MADTPAQSAFVAIMKMTVGMTYGDAMTAIMNAAAATIVTVASTKNQAEAEADLASDRLADIIDANWRNKRG